MDSETVNGETEFPPDLKKTDIEVRLTVRPAGLFAAITKKEFLFYDTFFSVNTGVPVVKSRPYPYSEIIAITEVKRGTLVDLTFTVQDEKTVKLAGISPPRAGKIRELTGK